MKVCKSCLIEKDESEFYKHLTNKDGLKGTCKNCEKERSKRNYQANIERYRKYHRERSGLQHLVDGRRRYRKTKDGIESQRKSVEKYKLKNPLKAKAHSIVFNAIRGKKLERKPCEICGLVYSHAHHDDYTKPLEVRWLCKIHHTEWHKENGEGFTGQ